MIFGINTARDIAKLSQIYVQQFGNITTNHAITYTNLKKESGAPNVHFRKISVPKTISDLEFSEHLL